MTPVGEVIGVDLDEVKLELAGSHDRINPQSVADSLAAVTRLLSSLPADLTEELALSNLRLGSAKVTIRTDKGRTRLLAEGIDALRSTPAIPQGWNPKTVEAVMELDRIRHRAGVEGILLHTTSVIESIDDALSANARVSIQPSRPSLGGARGKLYRYNSDAQNAGLVDDRTGARVKLRFPLRLADRVRPALDHVVEVWGEVYRDQDDAIQVIEMEGIEVLRRAPDAVTLDDVVGILGRDWTGGLGSVEWVRRQRG